jgi:hypothetical protein
VNQALLLRRMRVNRDDSVSAGLLHHRHSIGQLKGAVVAQGMQQRGFPGFKYRRANVDFCDAKFRATLQLVERRTAPAVQASDG